MGPRFSIIPAVAVCDASLTTLDLRILALLGCHTDQNGWCFRNQARMAEELGVARRSVNRSIGNLEKRGYLEKRDINQAAVDAGRRKKGMRSICVYRVLLDARGEPSQAVIDAQLDDEIDENPEKTAESSLRLQSPNGWDSRVSTVETPESQLNVPLGTSPFEAATSDPKSDHLQRQQQQKNNEAKQAEKEKAARGSKQGRLGVDTPQTPAQTAQARKEASIVSRREEAVALYNKHAGRCGMLRARTITVRRAKLLDGLFKREPAEWRAGLEKLASAVFPTRSGWHPKTLEAVIMESTFNALLEGQFDPPQDVQKADSAVKLWRFRMEHYRKYMALSEHERHNPATGQYLAWNASEWGPEPGKTGCMVPGDILAEFEADIFSLELTRWRFRVKAWKDGGKKHWPSEWGAQIGTEKCLVPGEILREFGLTGDDSRGESVNLVAE